MRDIIQPREISKKQRFWFRCFKNSRIFGIDGCKETHNRLVYKGRDENKTNMNSQGAKRKHEKEVIKNSHT